MNRFVAILGSMESHAQAVRDFIKEQGLVADTFLSTEGLAFSLKYEEGQWHFRGYSVVLIVDDNYQPLWYCRWPSRDHVLAALWRHKPQRTGPAEESNPPQIEKVEVEILRGIGAK